MKKYLFVLLLACALIVLTGCDVTITSNGQNNNPQVGVTIPAPSGSTVSGSGSSSLGKQTKTSGCVPHGGLPDSACTPGAIFPNATPDVICQYGYTRTVRNVPFSEKEEVYTEYGISHHSPGEYEVDHLVPLELGGSNDIANLWPEAAYPQPGFHEKDQVENYLHDQMCSGAISLQEAQKEIAANWLAVYNRMPKQ